MGDHATARGRLFHFEARFLGRTLAYTYEVREYEPGECFVMATTEGPFPMETTYSCQDAGEGTLMKLRNRGEPSGFAAITAPMMERAMRLANQADLKRLKALLET